jgi:hypothetical protein
MLGVGRIGALGQASWRRAAGAGAPVTDPIVTAINADGWSVTATSPPTMDPVGAPRFVRVNRQGYVAGVGLSSFLESTILTKRVRLPFPDQATLNASRVANTASICSTDTITGVTNNSALTSPKPIANWAVVPKSIVGDTIEVEVTAFHWAARNNRQVAYVTFTATDGTNSITPVTVSEPTLSPNPRDVYPVIVYRAVLNVAGLANPADITVNAEVYPHVGGVGSVERSADNAANPDRRAFRPLVFWRNTSRLTNRPTAYVALAADAGDGVGTPTASGVASTSLATAKATPFNTISNAIVGLRSAFTSIDGCQIVLQIGTHTDATNPAALTYQLGNAEVVIERDYNNPAATRSNTIFAPAATWGFRSHMFKLRGITYRRTGAFTFSSATAGGQLVMEDVAFDNNSQSAALLGNANTMGYLDGVAATTVGGSTLNQGASNIIAMLRGVDMFVVSAGTGVEMFNVIGSRLRSVNQAAIAARNNSGCIVACSELLNLTTGALGGMFTGTKGNVAAYANLVVEFISTTGASSMRPSSDDATDDFAHCVMHNITMAGFGLWGRLNAFYNETNGVARFGRFLSVKGCIFPQMNTKHDTWHGINDAQPADAPNRVGVWCYLYGVDCAGNLEINLPANPSSESQEFYGLGSIPANSDTIIDAAHDPKWVTPAHTTAGPVAGGGGGNYRLQAGSAALGILTNPVLAFDLAGNPRPASNDAAGAYGLAA